MLEYNDIRSKKNILYAKDIINELCTKLETEVFFVDNLKSF